MHGSDDEIMPERLELDGCVVTSLPLGSFTATYDLLDGMTSQEAVSFLDGYECATDARVYAHVFAVEKEDHLVLVDAGMGSGTVLGKLYKSLQLVGIHKDRVDSVVMTHLYPDHANGLLDPGFSRATVYVPAAEIAFARDPDAIAAGGAHVSRDYASAARVLDALGDRLVEIPDQLDGDPLPVGFTAISLPGHSPGHTGYRLDTASCQILFVGDLLHFPELQGRRPDVSVLPDFDGAVAAQTRRRVLEQAASNRTVLAGAHLGARGFRTVISDATGTRLERPDLPSPGTG